MQMSTFERRAVECLERIKKFADVAKHDADNCLEILSKIYRDCENTLSEYDNRNRRLGGKENLSKDAK